MHLAFLDAEGFKKVREWSSYRNKDMPLLPTTLADHRFFHGKWA
jgi:hypothetical protein